MRIVFKNVTSEISDCDCCPSSKRITETGPFVVETNNTDISIEAHAKIAFETIFCKVISFEHEVVAA